MYIKQITERENMTINKQKQILKKEIQSLYGLDNTELNDLFVHYAQLGIIGITEIKKQLKKDVQDAGKENFFLTKEIA